jgi:hypothetical protein
VNTRYLLWIFPWLLLPSLWGQVKVSVQLDQEQFLPGEEISIKVRVVNHSGQTLTFGKDNRWLQISVQAADSFVVSRLGDVPVEGRFELPPSKMATKVLDISPYFAMTQPGRYTIVAMVLVEEWGETLTSLPESFDVISGRKLWEQAFGLPNSFRADGSPEVRKYLLQQANYVRSQIRLYARITDLAEEQTFGVVPIGPMVSFSRPTALVDGDSNLHVLYQSGPRVSTYCKLDPDGEILIYEKREYSAAKPRLSATEDGNVTVIGGVALRLRPESRPAQELKTRDDEEG